jgi:ATP-dependent DNA helicase RecG
MNWREVESLLAAGRGPHVDVATERIAPSRLAETLVALANAEGGTVILAGGARPPAGLAEPEAALERAMEAVLLCEPRLVMPLPALVSDGDSGAAVVVMQVPRGLPHVYAVAGRYLRREGRENRPLASVELVSLLIRRGQLGYDAQEVADAGADDMDWARVQRYGEALGLMPALSPQEVLRRRGGWVHGGGRPTYAGLLMFGREPDRVVRSAEIVAVRYAGPEMGDRFIREEISGTLPDQITRAEAFAMANMRHGARLVGMERVERPEFPREAVREAIVNAVAHRDYSVAGDGIRLLMFSDRIEIYSPGRLPGHVTVDNILDERFSRNEVIVQMLADMGYIERLGYGIDRMVALLRAEGLPDPTFEETANGFRVVLRGAGERMVAPRGAAGRWQGAGINSRQALAMTYLDEHEQISSREYQALCPDVSAETLRRDLAELVSKGILLKIGQKRGTYYVLR